MTLLAFASGASALVYEVVWFQLLELTLGSTAVSLAVILTTFMGGLCLGSVLFPRLVPSRSTPLRVYAVLEAGIAVSGVAVLALLPLAGRAYAAAVGYGLPGFLLRGVLAAVCLLPPTLLMGATLPALARRVRATVHGVSWLGFFYAGNIAGAVAGCLVAGFWLLRVYDVGAATFAAAGVNVTTAAAALALSASAVGRMPVPSDGGALGTQVAERWPVRRIHWAIAMSGFTALAAEAIWTRTLGLLFGASVYGLSIILAVFLACLGLGSGLGSLVTRSLGDARRALGACQLLLGAAIAWTAWTVVASLPYWPIDPAISSDIAFNFQLDLVRALWALLPPTVLWGASFPLALAASRPGVKDPARLVAGVYAANTLGAMAGALLTSLVLVPRIGSQGAQQVLIGLSVAAGLMLTFRRTRGNVGLTAAAVAAAALLISAVPPMSGLLVAHGRFAATWVGKGDVVYSAEGLNASVAVSDFPGGVRTFHVAGKIQASSAPRDMRLQRMLGHLTTLTASDPRSVLVIGHGAGVTAGAVSIDPGVGTVTIVEIEPRVPEAAAAWFADYNFEVAKSPKVRVEIDDGRHFLLTTDDRFDAITADPLDPWVRGAASLYTREFLEEMKRHLNPGGVVTMYVQLFETTREAVRSELATFFEVFPDGTIWGNTYQGLGYDLVLLGRDGPFDIDLDAMEERLGRPGYAPVRASLEEVGFPDVIDLFATYTGRGKDLTRWLGDAPINRDRNLRLQYLAGMGLNEDESASIYAALVGLRRFPEDMFTSAEGRAEALREAIPETRR